jgi:hypothetical protein
MGNGLIDNGGLSVLVQVVRCCVYTRHVGEGAVGERGEEGSCDQQTGYKLPTVRRTRGESGSRKAATWNQLQQLLPWRARMLQQGRSDCARGSGQSHHPLDAFHDRSARHCGMVARNNLAPGCPLASCLLTDARQRRPSFAAQASKWEPVFFLL